MAEAIHTASRWEAKPDSAVTKPPVPRWASPLGPNVTGPRLLTSTSGGRCAGAPFTTVLAPAGSPRRRSCAVELAEDLQIVAQVAWSQEVAAHGLLAATPQCLAQSGIFE